MSPSVSDCVCVCVRVCACVCVCVLCVSVLSQLRSSAEKERKEIQREAGRSTSQG